MDLHLWAGFALASFIMGVIPGPGVASIVGFAFSSGRVTALASVAGMAVGNAIAISVSLAGAGALLALSALAFTILKWIGAAYLIGLGLFAIGRSAAPSGAVGRAPGGTGAIRPRTAFLTNVGVGTFHPKTILFFVAFATQFISSERPYLPQAALLVATFTAVAGATDTAYALLASRASGLLQSTRARRWAGRAGGGALVAAGVATAALQR